MSDKAYLTIRGLSVEDKIGLALWAASEGRSLDAHVTYLLKKAMTAQERRCERAERKPAPKRAKGKG